jgi:Ca-activated chloride channel family protein
MEVEAMLSDLAAVHFKHPWLLWLLILPVVLLVYHFRFKVRQRPHLTISSTQSFSNRKPTLRVRLSELPVWLRFFSLSLLVVALARPQSSSSASNVRTEGISIVIALDISSSMLAEDFRPNRIEAAKKVAQEFIDGRPNDLVGLVVFSGEGFTQCPITTDHSVLRNLLKDVKSGWLRDGTAIGDGLATAINRVKDAPTKSKVVVIITDGVSNAGSIAPATAGEIAQTLGVRVYSVGVGTMGQAPFPVKTLFGIQYQNMDVEIDEKLLTSIAESTNGKYFRAVNNRKLEAIFQEIDKLEKSKIEVTEFKRYTERYLPFALSALLLFLLELLLRYTWLKTLP